MNPFLQKSAYFDEAIPFNQIHLDHYLPALEKGIEEGRKNIAKIRQIENPNFNNVIEALECSSELLETVSGVYFNLFSAHANTEFQSLAAQISPLLAAYHSEVSLDEKLFEKVKIVFDQQNKFQLNKEQKMLLEKHYKSFVRNGALLSAEKKERLRQIDQELSLLSPKFSEHHLNAINQFELILDKQQDLAGLPEMLIQAAAQEASSKGHKGKWKFTLQYPSYLPFMKYSAHPHLREKMWMAYNSLALHGENNNQEIVLKTVKLRQERARLLGFADHASFVLAERMAKDVTTVMSFLDRITQTSRPAAEKDLKELKSYRKKADGTDEIHPWDVAYYSEKLKEEKFGFSEEDLRPYFKLDNVISGALEHARKLFGLTFTKKTDIPTYHPEVDVYEVRDEKTGNYIGLFYTDFFPRETKKTGAWATTYREQGLWSGQVRRPHASIVCNFTKPTFDKPSLLDHNEVNTLFHELGHALHMLLSQCHYRSLAGTSVYWDFVELPSQIMENWTVEKASLDLFAKHYQTQETIPADLVRKLNETSKFQSGYMCLRQMGLSYLDMKWHTMNASEINDVREFEKEIMSKYRLFPHVEGTNFSTSFAHIFAGGYSAGYYSYKWAEVLDADAFEFFKEKGLYNLEVAHAFRDQILARGATEHPMELYKKFRGREPDPNALLRRDGLI